MRCIRPMARSDSARKFCLTSIHPAETFPLALSIGVLIQAIAFAGVQGTGLGALTEKSCGTVAQVMLPGMWVLTK